MGGMASREIPIVRRPRHGRTARKTADVVDRANGFTIGRIVKVEIPGIGRSPVVQWWAWTDTGHELGPHPLRRSAVDAIWGHYRKHDTVRYACGRMAA